MDMLTTIGIDSGAVAHLYYLHSQLRSPYVVNDVRLPTKQTSENSERRKRNRKGTYKTPCSRFSNITESESCSSSSQSNNDDYDASENSEDITHFDASVDDTFIRTSSTALYKLAVLRLQHDIELRFLRDLQEVHSARASHYSEALNKLNNMETMQDMMLAAVPSDRNLDDVMSPEFTQPLSAEMRMEMVCCKEHREILKGFSGAVKRQGEVYNTAALRLNHVEQTFNLKSNDIVESMQQEISKRARKKEAAKNSVVTLLNM